MGIEKKNFIGGLNSDVEDRLVPNGDYRFALNVRASKSDGASQGAIENTKGNTIVFVTLPEGVNKVIGALDNTVGNTVIYCVWNDLENHSIFEYDASTSSVSLLLRSPLLNFKHNKYINDATIVGGSFFFNDRVNPPRSLNIERARANEYPTPFLEEYMNVIVKAPGFAPVANYMDDTPITNPGSLNVSGNTNNVRGKLFQFRYKWVYLDNEQSAWSPISKVPLPVNESIYRPAGYYPLHLNNHINVEVNLGGDYVKRVKIAVREGNTGDFLLIEDFDKAKAGFSLPFPDDWSYDFYNDEVLLPIDNDGNSGMRLFDNVPQLADSMSQIDGNKIAFGGVTEGYDPVDVDMDINLNISNSVARTAPMVWRPISSALGSDSNQGVDPYGYCWHRSEREKIKLSWNSYTWKERETDKYRQVGDKKYVVIKAQTQDYANFGSNNLYDYGRIPVFNFGPLTTVLWWNQLGYKSWSRGSNTPSVNTNPVHDRVMHIDYPVLGPVASDVMVCGSVMNEVIFGAPNGAGTRYVLKVDIGYRPLGTSADKTVVHKIVKFQYVSEANDTASDVADAFKDKLSDLGTLHENYVDIRFSHSNITDGWSFGTQAAVPSGQALLRIKGEAYVPKKHITKDEWYATSGPDIGAAYNMTTEIKAYGAWTLENNKSLKSGATHGFGLVYYDDENRSGLTNVSKVMGERKVYLPFFGDRKVWWTPSGGEVPDPTSVTLTIKHFAPAWAKRYQVVYTGNQTVSYIPGVSGYKGFIQCQLKKVNENTVPSGNAVGAINATLDNIKDYNENVPENVDLSYSFNKGDRMRFMTNSIWDTTKPPVYLDDTKDVEVISYDTTSRVIQFKDPGIVVNNNMMIEIYTPKKDSEDPVYREVGECYPIINGMHMGNDTNQLGTIPAKVVLEDVGDVYLRYRTAPVSCVIESYAYSDFYPSDSWDKGRPNIVDNNITKTKRNSTIRYSNNYIPETNINGLSQFDDFDFKQYDEQYGDIQRMYSIDKDLVIFQNLKVGKVRIGQTTLYGNEGTSIATVKSQNTVLSDVVYATGEFGIGKNPESFAVYGNRKYFVDAARGVVLRLSTDGLTPISEYGMHNYFTDKLSEVMNAGGDFKLFGEYDMRFDEYVLSIQGDITMTLPVKDVTVDDIGVGTGDAVLRINSGGPVVRSAGVTGVITDVDGMPAKTSDTTGSVSSKVGLGGGGAGDVDGSGGGPPKDDGSGDVYVPATVFNPDAVKETIAFSEMKKKWCTFYSYIPDYLVNNNSKLLSFKDGAIYKHNDNLTYNNFYQKQFTSKLKLISNVEPSIIKVYNSVFLESNKPWSFPSITNQFNQESSLIVEDFVDDEGVFKSNFLKDSNTPNVDLPLIEGDDLRCHSMTVEMENADTEEVKMFSVGINLTPSKLTNN